MIASWHSLTFHFGRSKCIVSSPSSTRFLHLFITIILLMTIIEHGKSIALPDAKPTSLVLPPSQPSPLTRVPNDRIPSMRATATSTTSPRYQVVNLTRQYGGDMFNAINVASCDMDTCVGLSSGTAGLYRSGMKEIDASVGVRAKSIGRGSNGNDNCKCQCLPHLESFREDLSICIDDIHECKLAPFVSGSTSEKIPFVFLPLRGQIIHPSKEIAFQGMKSPVCAVSGAQYLTSTGWSELRSSVDLDVPFRLFRDEGRTFLQWLGDDDLRHKMQGRLILVHLMCRDMALITREALISAASSSGRSAIKPKKDIQNLFSPCVSFRVVGMPVKYANNVTEVSFQSEATSSSITSIEGLTAKEYIVIALCSLILGLIYVASVFLYIHVKRNKNRSNDSEANGNNPPGNAPKSNFPPNDQVTFGNGFNRGNYNRSISSINGDRLRNSARDVSLNGLGNEEHGIVKNNPLLKHYPNLSDNSGFTSDLSNSNSDEERAITNEISHMSQQSFSASQKNDGTGSSAQETECLPEANVSIIEDMTNEDKLESMKAIVSGTMRRKLYFNPAYFEPHLLLSPPPAALEFLAKIREVITMAKYKMAAKRFQPSLIVIPEERAASQLQTIMTDSIEQDARTSTATSKDELSKKKTCSGCPGCDKNDTNSSSGCKNCGDKRNSIRKWLEGVSKHENQLISEDNNEPASSNKDDTDDALGKETNKTNESSSSSDSDTVKANSIGSRSSKKRKAPSIPLSAEIELEQRDESLSIYSKSPSPQIDGSDIYNSLSVTGSEIYNNPQFMHGSPPLSHRSHASRHSRSTNLSAKRHIEVMDQYANPAQLRKTEMMKNLQKMPDMVYEAITKDYSKRDTMKSNYEYLYSPMNMPTPDYDDPYNSTYSRRKQTNETAFIPPPDYNSIGRRQYQPDSPIYRRKSPHHLIVDYETDSLERTHTNKMNRNSVTPHSNNSSDLSSQPSPSLSSALPLEEEAEFRNTVYDRIEGHRKDDSPIKMIPVIPKSEGPISRLMHDEFGSVSNAYLRSRRSSFSKEPVIKYNTPFHGSMTIEVDHEPTDDELSSGSDQFEPDTLDRKPKKVKNSVINDIPNNQRNIPMRRNSDSYSFIDNSKNALTSLPENNLTQRHSIADPQQVVLRSNGSFKSNSLGNYLTEIGGLVNDTSTDKNFCSLREIYAAKNQKNLLQRSNYVENDDKSRTLTLEERHSKRQRQKTLDKNIKKPLPPDIIPNGRNIYGSMKKDDSIENIDKIMEENLTSWGSDEKSNRITDESLKNKNIESNDIARISEIHPKTEKDVVLAYSQVRKLSSQSNRMQNTTKQNNKEASRSIDTMDKKDNYMNLSELQCSVKSQEHSDDNSDSSTLKTGSTKFYYKSNLNKQPSSIKDNNPNAEKCDISLHKAKEKHLPRIIDTSTKELIHNLANDTTAFNPLGSVPPTKVFHVDISPPSNGMQIALGIRDRAKKSKDLKNAWKKFVNLATSKFQSPNTATSSKSEPKGDYDLTEKQTTMSDITDRDDGIASLNTCDDNMTVSSAGDAKTNVEILSRSPSSSSSSDIAQRPTKSEMDYGYISADSNESKAQNKKLYERFNFKNTKSVQEPCTSRSAIQSSEEHQTKPQQIRMQKIKENIESEQMSPRFKKAIVHPTNAPPPPPCHLSQKSSPTISNVLKTAQLIDYVPKNAPALSADAMNVRIYSSSDDDRYSSGLSSESDEEGNLDEMCESGAESVETHSVLFKNIRKSNEQSKQ